jgi:hypothetical protein
LDGAEGKVTVAVEQIRELGRKYGKQSGWGWEVGSKERGGDRMRSGQCGGAEEKEKTL